MKYLLDLSFMITILDLIKYIEGINIISSPQNLRSKNFKDRFMIYRSRRGRVVNIHNLTSLVYYKNMSNFPYLINFNLSLLHKNDHSYLKPNKIFGINPNEFIFNSSQKLLATIDQAINNIIHQHAINETRMPVNGSLDIFLQKYDQGLNKSRGNDYFDTNFNNSVSMYDDPNGLSMDFADNGSFSWYDDLRANLTGTYEEQQPPNPYGTYTLGQYVIIIILTILLSTMTIFGNLLVLFSFVIERTLRQPTNYYIVSLAVSDLIIGMISMPFYSLYLLLGSWPLGELLCDLWLSIDYTVCLASQYTVFFITLDRYCSVKIPASYRQWRTAFKVKFMIYCAWAIPIGIFFSAIIGWQYIFKSRGVEPNQCYVPFRDNRVFNTSLIFFYYWSTLVVLVSLYAGIYKVAYDLSKKSIEKEKRARALVEHAVLSRTEMKKGGRELKGEKKAKAGGKSSALLTLKDAKDFPDETTSFSRDDQTKDKEKSSSVSFPSDTDSQNENSFIEVTNKNAPKKNEVKKEVKKGKFKENVKSSDKKKPRKLSPKLNINTKNQYALNHLEPIRLLSPKTSMENLQQHKSNEKSVTLINIVDDSNIVKFVEEEVQKINELEDIKDNMKHNIELKENIETTTGSKGDKEEQLNKILNNLKSYNIRITTNTPAIRDGDDYEEDDLDNLDNDALLNCYKKAHETLVTEETPMDRKNLTLKGLKNTQAQLGDKKISDSVKTKNNLTNSYSFQSTATTLTPLTPYTDDDGTNMTKKFLLSSSLSPLPPTSTPVDSKLTNQLDPGKTNGSKDVKDAKNNGGDRRCNSIISNIVSFGKRNSKDSKYIGGSSSICDGKSKHDVVTSGDKSSNESKGNKGARDSVNKRRKSLSIIIKFKKKRKANSERKKSKSENRARKALRTITCIMGAFVLCWTPYHICETIRGFNPDFPINEHFYSFTYWLCYLNSPLNPFMYALANQQFKKTFIRIFKCDLHKN